MYPPIKGSGVVTKDDATKHIRLVLNGLQGGKAGGVLYTSPMPAFGGVLNDVETGARPGRRTTRSIQMTELHSCRSGSRVPVAPGALRVISTVTETARAEIPATPF